MAGFVLFFSFATAVVGTSSGCKGDREKCAQAAQNYAELVYWARENPKLEKLPPEQREAERKRKLVEFQQELDSQLDFRVQQCVAANNDDQVDCMIAAKTSEAALKCAEVAKGE